MQQPYNAAPVLTAAMLFQTPQMGAPEFAPCKIVCVMCSACEEQEGYSRHASSLQACQTDLGYSSRSHQARHHNR